MKKTITIFLFGILILAVLAPQRVLATQGCCSHHEGVCGCDSSRGRQVCCDGTYSPSCTCAYIPPTPKPTPQPTLKPTIKPTASPTPKPTDTPTQTPTPSPEPEVKGILTEEASPTPTTMPSAGTKSTQSSGSPAGGLGVLALLGAGGFWLYRRLKNRKK